MSARGATGTGRVSLAVPSGALLRQFFVYAAVGAVATAVDWGSFYACIHPLGIHYALAVVVSFLLGATTNYTLNRWITFRDRTRAIAAQVTVYAAVSLVSLLMSVGLMALGVEVVHLSPMGARIVTTGVMLLANFVMHKAMTFNPALYRRFTGEEPVGTGREEAPLP